MNGIRSAGTGTARQSAGACEEGGRGGGCAGGEASWTLSCGDDAFLDPTLPGQLAGSNISTRLNIDVGPPPARYIGVRKLATDMFAKQVVVMHTSSAVAMVSVGSRGTLYCQFYLLTHRVY